MNKVLALACVCATLLFACESTTTTTPEPYKVPLCDSMPSGTSAFYVRVSEIVPNPDGTDDNTENWTIKNYRSDSTVDVSGYYFYDSDGIGAKWTLPAGTVLGKCASLKVVSDKGAQLSNAGDTLFFYNDKNILIQTIGFPATGEGEVVKVK